MARSNRFASLVAIACIAAGAFAAVAVASRDYVVAAVRGVWDFTLNLFRAEPVLLPVKPSQEKPLVALVAAKAFGIRVVQRRRPERHPNWVMSPAT